MGDGTRVEGLTLEVANTDKLISQGGFSALFPRPQCWSLSWVPASTSGYMGGALGTMGSTSFSGKAAGQSNESPLKWAQLEGAGQTTL